MTAIAGLAETVAFLRRMSIDRRSVPDAPLPPGKMTWTVGMDQQSDETNQ